MYIANSSLKNISLFAGTFCTCALLLHNTCLLGQASQAQIDAASKRPYKVYGTVPAILDGPFLLDSSQTSATIVWITDTPCHPKVEYGEDKLDHEAVPEEYGLVPVGTLQKVEITGLIPGHTYHYRVVSTPVVRLRPYFPDKGRSVESPTYAFTTFDEKKPAISFSFITDTHEDIQRINTLMRAIDWTTTDFLVNGGDGVNYAQSQEQVFDNWIEPISGGLDHAKPLIYIRGNHDMRGPFARDLSRYLLPPSRQYYYTRDDGPVHLIIIDTGEDKPANGNEYAGLVDEHGYREQEYDWLQNIVPTDPRMASAPFRVILMHQPKWGWLDGENQKWTDLANREKIDLVMAGHMHRFSISHQVRKEIASRFLWLDRIRLHGLTRPARN